MRSFREIPREQRPVNCPLTEVLWEECEAFAERDLSGFEVECLILDAVYQSLRQQGGGKEGVRGCLKLVLTTVWRASQRWQGVRMTEIECQQLKFLRREIGQPADDKRDTVELNAGRLERQRTASRSLLYPLNCSTYHSSKRSRIVRDQASDFHVEGFQEIRRSATAT